LRSAKEAGHNIKSEKKGGEKFRQPGEKGSKTPVTGGGKGPFSIKKTPRGDSKTCGEKKMGRGKKMFFVLNIL